MLVDYVILMFFSMAAFSYRYKIKKRLNEATVVTLAIHGRPVFQPRPVPVILQSFGYTQIQIQYNVSK